MNTYPRTFVINLDRDAERMVWMQRELNRIGLSFERVPALTFSSIPQWIRDQFVSSNGNPYGALSEGEIGCYASHLSIMRRIVDENYQLPVLVLEDDLRIDSDIIECIQKIEKYPHAWDIIRLSNCSKSPYFSEQLIGGERELVRYWRVPNNTGAYLINIQGANKFLQAYTRRSQAIDEDLRRPWNHQVITYGVEPAPITSNIFQSSIEEMGVRSDQTPDIRMRKLRHSLEVMSMIRYAIKQFGIMGCLRAISRRLSFVYKRSIRGISKCDLDYKISSYSHRT